MTRGSGGSSHRLIPLIGLFLLVAGGMNAGTLLKEQAAVSPQILVTASATLPSYPIDDDVTQAVRAFEGEIVELLVDELRSYARFGEVRSGSQLLSGPTAAVLLHADVVIEQVRPIDGGDRILVEGICSMTSGLSADIDPASGRQMTTAEIAGIGNDLASALLDAVGTLSVYIRSILLDHTHIAGGGSVRYVLQRSVLIDPQGDPDLTALTKSPGKGDLLSIETVPDEQVLPPVSPGSALLRVTDIRPVITSRGVVDFIEAVPIYTEIDIVPGMAAVPSHRKGQTYVPIVRGAYSAAGIGVEVFDERVDLLDSALLVRPLLELGLWYSWDDPYPDGSIQASEEGLILFGVVGSSVGLDIGSGPEQGRFPLINTRILLSAALGAGIMSPAEPITVGHGDILIIGGRGSAGCEWSIAEDVALGAGGCYDFWFPADGSTDPVFSLFSGQFRVTMRF